MERGGHWGPFRRVLCLQRKGGRATWEATVGSRSGRRTGAQAVGQALPDEGQVLALCAGQALAEPAVSSEFCSGCRGAGRKGRVDGLAAGA